MKNPISKFTEFIKKHPVYFTGYGVTTITYFCRYVHQLHDDLAAQAVLFVWSGIIGLASWAYIAARVVNSLCD